MTISKAQWNTEGDSVRLSLPFAKVDKERRIVSGFASLDNLDKQGDIVTSEASLKAFSKFRGNIREMHQPLAVGKMVNFKEDKYFDPESKKFYSGVFVSAYVSKGAQDTWEKVLDGTLTGFSIGGRMNKWDDGYDEKSDSTIRIIKDYDLVELSLVDSPANQFANIMSVEKVDGVDIVKGQDVELENVFYDEESGIVMVSDEESVTSPITPFVRIYIFFPFPGCFLYLQFHLSIISPLFIPLPFSYIFEINFLYLPVSFFLFQVSQIIFFFLNFPSFHIFLNFWLLIFSVSSFYRCLSFPIVGLFVFYLSF